MVFMPRTASASRSEPWIGGTSGDPLGLILLACVYVKIFFTFSPFQRGVETVSTGGSWINQLYWLSLLGFAGVIIWRNWETALQLLRRTWIFLIPMAWFAITMLWSPAVDVSLRRTILVILMAGVTFGVAASRPSPSDFLKVTAAALGAILLISVVSVFVVPHLARGTSQFIGIYSHKNSAGYVSGLTFIVWTFLMMSAIRFEVKIMAFFGSLLWLFFLVGTQSKTSLGLALLVPAISITLFYVFMLDLSLRVMSYIAGLVGVGLLVLGVLFIDWTLEDIGILIFEDLTFTNRTALWEYVLRSIDEAPIFGHGYGAFWWSGEGLANRLDADPGSGWATNATSAHNGYLNIWLESGLIGLILCGSIMLMVLFGVLDLLKYTDDEPASRWVYAMMLALLLFLFVRDLMEASMFKAHSGSTLLFFLISHLVWLWRWQSQQRLAQMEQV